MEATCREDRGEDEGAHAGTHAGDVDGGRGADQNEARWDGGKKEAMTREPSVGPELSGREY